VALLGGGENFRRWGVVEEVRSMRCSLKGDIGTLAPSSLLPCYHEVSSLLLNELPHHEILTASSY
jgi:hypothetical protein